MKTIRFVFSYLPYLYFLYFILIVIIILIMKVVDEIFGLSCTNLLSSNLDTILIHPSYVVLILSSMQAFYNYHKIGNMHGISNEEKKLWRRFYRVWLVFANAEYYDKFICDFKSETFVKFTKFIKLKPISIDSFK